MPQNTPNYHPFITPPKPPPTPWWKKPKLMLGGACIAVLIVGGIGAAVTGPDLDGSIASTSFASQVTTAPLTIPPSTAGVEVVVPTTTPATTPTTERVGGRGTDGKYPLPQFYSGGAWEMCGVYYEEDWDSSIYEFDDYDVYCEAFTYGLDNIGPGVCAEWRVTDDADILDTFMSPDGGDHDWDGAVGLLDAVWAVCQ